MKFSDHQPFLFGHAGYWSKIAVCDQHIVMADVEYRPEDKLGKCRLDGGLEFGALLASDLMNPSIFDMRLASARKLRQSVEQNLMNKRMPYRERLEPLLPLLLDGAQYVGVWAKMAEIVKEHAGINTKFRWSLIPAEGSTTFERNMNRVYRAFRPTSQDTYVCGPAVREYGERTVLCPAEIMIHEMERPSPVSFVESIVRDKSPTLGLSELKAVSW